MAKSDPYEVEWHGPQDPKILQLLRRVADMVEQTDDFDAQVEMVDGELSKGLPHLAPWYILSTETEGFAQSGAIAYWGHFVRRNDLIAFISRSKISAEYHKAQLSKNDYKTVLPGQ